MKSAVIVFPGSNCDYDCIKALTHIGDAPQAVWHGEATLPKVDLLILPGGFSWGDYLRPGAIAATAPAVKAALRAANGGTPLLGICNGFQILLEAGCLPGALIRNRHLNFICEEVRLRVASTASIFTDCYKSGEEISFPIAHQDGQYFCDADTLKRLQDDDLIAMRYLNNPNGSIDGIAALGHPTLPIFGLMPHPERAMNGGDGSAFLRNLAGRL